MTRINRHFLVTVSDQKSALYGVKFIDRLFETKENIKLTLFYTYPKSPTQWESRGRDNTYINLTRKYESRGKDALASAKEVLCQMGFGEHQVVTNLAVREKTTAKDILQEGARGRYDAVVLGKRGVGWLAETFEESVTKNLLKESFGFPIWLCRLSDSNKSGILVCIDGSDAAFRMADHVGYILNSDTRQNVTLLTVTQTGENADALLERARQLFLKNHFPAGQITTRVTRNKSPAKAIITETRSGGYAAVAVGRREKDAGMIKNMFLGSVSSQLFDNLAGAALWICH